MSTRHQTYSQAEVDAWNLAHPVGTACRYEDGPGNWIPTITRSTAWLLGHGVPVVKIEGKSGGYGIDCLSFPDLAEHYRTILHTIEGVLGTPPGTETDLNTLPERVAKAVVRVPEAGEKWGPYEANDKGWFSLKPKADHTPGPLVVQRDDGYIENWRVVKMLPDGPAQVAGAFTEEDAKLFAAAPELVAALESLLLCPDLNWDELEPATFKAIEASRVAIAKAKGQA